jgi:hypothetical protein
MEGRGRLVAESERRDLAERRPGHMVVRAERGRRDGMSVAFATAIWKAGINIVFIQHVPGARAWTRNENKNEKEKDVKEIESGNTGEEFSGLDDTFGPCAPPSGQGCPILP